MGFWHVYMGIYGGSPVAEDSGTGFTEAGQVYGNHSKAAQVTAHTEAGQIR